MRQVDAFVSASQNTRINFKSEQVVRRLCIAPSPRCLGQRRILSSVQGGIAIMLPGTPQHASHIKACVVPGSGHDLFELHMRRLLAG